MFASEELITLITAVVATSGPSSTYPQRAYRNPTDALVNWLDSKHGSNWAIWEFRAEGTGYPDSEVYNRIHHFPWPDHHPPPFALIPNIMGGMRNWVQRLDEKDGDQNEPGDRIVVVHCKAGKGRSGTIACSYLISQEGWKKEDALQRFTERRMRAGFGAGVSIPSQLRYVGYVDRWTNELQKQYIERPVEILELHIWGLRDGVKVVVQGFEDEGKRIKNFHKFHRQERTVVEAGQPAAATKEAAKDKSEPSSATTGSSTDIPPQSGISRESTSTSTNTEGSLSAIIYKPRQPIIVSGSDVNIDFERRSKVSYTGLALVTSLAHVWFNPYFEGGNEHDSGVFEIQWDAMDGIKGSYKKGIRALERLKVVWRYPPPQPSSQGKHSKKESASAGRPVSEPKPGEPIHESEPADWRGEHNEQENKPPSPGSPTGEVRSDVQASQSGGEGTGIIPALAETVQTVERQLGLRPQTDASKDVSLAGTEDEMPSTTEDEEEGQKDSKKKDENHVSKTPAP